MTIMMYGFWYIKHDGQDFLSFWAIFCPFGPIAIQKIEILRKWKKLQEVLSFTQVHQAATDRVFLSSLAMFCPFTPLTAQKMKIWQSWKKAPGDSIILHECTKSHDHRPYCSWAMVCDRCNFYFSFWTIFYPFTPLTAQKLGISKKWKKHLEISSFSTSVKKSWS